jgi:iron complex transport system ATP-binding protein
VTALLEARGLTVLRGGRTVLRGVSLALGAGEALALVGPNAAGKSTLVRTLVGLLPAAEGGVWLLGRPLASWQRDAAARAVALVSPTEEGPDALTVEDRVALGRYPHRGPFRAFTSDDEAAVGRALEQTGIRDLARRQLGTLSAGERQLAARARGRAPEPPGVRLGVRAEVRARGVAVLAVVHDLQRAASWAGRMVLIAGGRVAAEGAPDAVLQSEACARAFGVAIRGHAIAGLGHPLYSFEDPV